MIGLAYSVRIGLATQARPGLMTNGPVNAQPQPALVVSNLIGGVRAKLTINKIGSHECRLVAISKITPISRQR